MSVLEDVIDAFRQIIPYYFVLIVPLLILISPIDPVKAAQQFTAFRLQQYDIQGVKIGSRSSAFNYEAQTSHSKSLSRKCLLLKLMEVSAASIKLAISQNVGSIVVLLPLKSSWDGPVREHILHLEKELLLEDFAIPIYFSFESPEVADIYESVRQLMETGKSSSAAQALLNSVTSNAYQLYTSSVAGSRSASQQPSEYQITNFYGKLPGNGIEEQLPTVLIVSHYDAMGMVPSLSYGYDSNASGVVMVLQLMRLFSRLYAIPKSQPKFNLAFLLTGGGKLNYIGTKRWLEEMQDGASAGVNGGVGAGAGVGGVSLAVCLERVGLADDGLFLHVSKPPKPGSSGQRLADGLTRAMRAWQRARNDDNDNNEAHSNSTSSSDKEGHSNSTSSDKEAHSNNTSSSDKEAHSNSTSSSDSVTSATSAHGPAVVLHHQKINLNEDELHWEHERFSLRKLAAVTVSGERDHLSNRRSMLDDRVALPVLARNTRVVADALMGLLYGLHDDDEGTGTGTSDTGDSDGASTLLERDWISEEAIAADLALLTSEPRSQQLLEQQGAATGSAGTAGRRHGGVANGNNGNVGHQHEHEHPLVASIATLFKRYLSARFTSTSRVRADPREPEFVLFGDAEMIITAHRVKPALFDLLVSSAIALYLGLVFLLIKHFSAVSRLLLRVTPAKLQHQQQSLKDKTS